VEVGPLAEFLDCVGGIVGQRVHLQPTPQDLHRVQFRRVGWEKLEVDGATPSAHAGLHRTMDVEAVPDDQERGTDLATELANEREELGRIDVRVGEQGEVKTHPVLPG